MSGQPAPNPPDSLSLGFVPNGPFHGGENDHPHQSHVYRQQSPLRGRPRPRTAGAAGRSGAFAAADMFVGFGQQVAAAVEGGRSGSRSRSRSRSRDGGRGGRRGGGGKRRITSISSRAVVGGVEDARRILQRGGRSDDGEEDDDDGSGADEGRAYHSADELDDLVDNGDYRGTHSLRRQQQQEEEEEEEDREQQEVSADGEDDEARRGGRRWPQSNERKARRPQSAREPGSSSVAANALNKAPSSPDSRRKERDAAPQSVMEAKLNKINENVQKSTNRLNKMLEKLRISTVALDPKSSEQIIAEAREKERRMKNITNSTVPAQKIRKPPQVAKGRAGLVDFLDDENKEREPSSSDHFPGSIPVVSMRVSAAPSNNT